MNRLDGKVAIITGTASGMGLEAVRLFAAEGAKVVATGRNLEKVERELGDVLSENENVKAMKLEVTSEEDWDAVVAETERIFGKIDILINNAGASVHADLLNETPEGWQKNIDANLTSVWLGMKKVIPFMQKNGKGSIVNCGSMSAIIGSADNGAAAYCAAKGGVASLSRHAAYNFAKDNIRVNVVHPGPIYTGAAKRYGCPSAELLGRGFADKIPLPPHAGEAIDIANAYLYLASDESKFVTGIEIHVDGGWGIL